MEKIREIIQGVIVRYIMSWVKVEIEKTSEIKEQNINCMELGQNIIF